MSSTIEFLNENIGIISIAAPGALAIIIFLAQQKIRHAFNKSMEEIRAERRTAENSLKELQKIVVQERQLWQSEIYSKQIESVAKLWDSIIHMAPAKQVAGAMSIFKYEKLDEIAAESEKLRPMFEMIEKLSSSERQPFRASSCRPFITERLWALYLTYSAIIFTPYMIMIALKSGLRDPAKFVKTENINPLLKEIFPGMEKVIDDTDPFTAYFFIESVEEEILKEIKSILSGEAHLNEGVTRYSDLIKRAEETLTAVSEPGAS